MVEPFTTTKSYTRLRQKTVPWVCENFGGDTEKVFLCGFSRGIACNFIGLHDDEANKHGVPSFHTVTTMV